MKWKGIILVILPVILTVLCLRSSDENFIGAIAAALFIAGLILAGLFSNPYVGGLFFVVGMHWFQLKGMSGSLYFASIATVLFLLIAIRKRDIRPDRAWRLSILLVCTYLAMIFGLHPYKIALTYFYMYITAFILFLVLSLYKWNAEKVQLFLSIHLLFSVIWTLTEWLILNPERIGGPTLSPTNFGVLLAVSWTTWLINGWLSKCMKWPILIIGSVLVLWAVIMSGTRMGMLGLAFGSFLSVFCYLLQKNHDRIIQMLSKYAVMVFALAGFVAIVWMLLPDDLFIKKGLELLASGKLDTSSLGRIGSWAAAWDIIHTDPVWGIGINNFMARDEAFLDKFWFLPFNNMIPRLDHSHNLVLMILSEHGIVGFAFIGGLCMICLYFLLRHIRRYWDGMSLALLSGFGVIMFTGLFDGFPFFPASLGWGAWYMSVMLSLRENEEKEN